MSRTFLPLVLLLAVTASTRAQLSGSTVCGGYFARYFDGYSMSHEEIYDLFLIASELVRATRRLTAATTNTLSSER